MRRSFVRSNLGLLKRYEQWMISLHYAPHTQHQYHKAVKRFLEFIGAKSAAKVGHVDVRKFMAWLSDDGASLHSVYRHLTVLRLFYDFLNLGGVVNYVAPRIVRMRGPIRNPLPILTEPQVQLLIGATRSLRERAFVEFLYGTGCRLREASHLRIEDLDFANRSAKVAGKFGKARTVLLTPNAVDALRAYIGVRTVGVVFQQEPRFANGCLYRSESENRWFGLWRDYGGSGPNFPRRRTLLGAADSMSREEARAKFDLLLSTAKVRPDPSGRPMSNMRLQEMTRQIGKRVGLKGVTPHMLRRSFASHLYDNGAGVEIIQRLLGHVFLQTTLVYTRLSTRRMVKTYEECHPRVKMHEPENQHA